MIDAEMIASMKVGDSMVLAPWDAREARRLIQELRRKNRLTVSVSV